MLLFLSLVQLLFSSGCKDFGCEWWLHLAWNEEAAGSPPTGHCYTAVSRSSMEGRAGNSPNSLINWGIQAPTLTKFFLDAKSFSGSLLTTDQVQVSYHSMLKPFDVPGGSDGKESACNAGNIRDAGLIPGVGRSPGGGHGNPLQYSCLGNPVDRRTCWATVHRVARSWTRLKLLSTHTLYVRLQAHVIYWCISILPAIKVRIG